MLQLNILPQKQKKENQLKYVFFRLKNVLGLLLLCTILYAIALLASKAVLSVNFVDTVEKTTILTKSTDNYSSQVRTINSKLNAVVQIQQSHVVWSPFFEYFRNLSTQNLRFDRISVEKDKNIFEVSGFAKDRDDLIQLKTAIENNSAFSDLNFPITNFLQKEDISFKFSGKFQNYEFTETE